MDGGSMTISTTTSTITIHSSGITAGATAGAGDLGQHGMVPSGAGVIPTLGATGAGDQAGTTAITDGVDTTMVHGTEDADLIVEPSPTDIVVANASVPVLWLTGETRAQAEVHSPTAQVLSAAVLQLQETAALLQAELHLRVLL